jgi:hypothetical protein
MSLHQKNETLLHSSATGDSAKVNEMIEKGADVNARDRFGDTSLHLAIKNRHLDIAESLINKGANINAAGALGDMPLHVSIYEGQKGLTELLLKKGASESFTNTYGLLPCEMQAIPEIENKVISTADLLNGNCDWIDRDRGRNLYDNLRGSEKKYVTNSLVLQVIKNQRMRLRILILAIKLGIEDSEERLANLLMVYGDKTMAEDYLNCGSSALDAAGRNWASAHGYRIHTGPGSHRAAWGRF